MINERAEITWRRNALQNTLESLSEARDALPEATPLLHRIGMLAIDLTVVGCVVNVQVLVRPGVLRHHPRLRRRRRRSDW